MNYSGAYPNMTARPFSLMLEYSYDQHTPTTLPKQRACADHLQKLRYGRHLPGDNGKDDKLDFEARAAGCLLEDHNTRCVCLIGFQCCLSPVTPPRFHLEPNKRRMTM